MNDNKERVSEERIVLSLVWNIYGQILLILKNGIWMLPGGHVDPFEKEEDTAFRENLEEVGLKVPGKYWQIFQHNTKVKDRPRVYTVYENSYIEPNLDVKYVLDEKEGIKDAGWFSLAELNSDSYPKLKASEMVFLTLDEVRKRHQSQDQLLARANDLHQTAFFMEWISKNQKTVGGFKKAGKIALIVDDDPGLLGVMTSILTHIGFRVLAYDNPLHVLEQMSGHLDIVDLVVSDWDMPKMKGDELIEIIKKENPRVIDFLFSGYSIQSVDPEDWGTFLQKPMPTVNL